MLSRLSAASLFPLVLAALLAGTSFWLERTSRTNPDGNDSKVRHDPDYRVENFVLRRFDVDGQLLHTLVGKEMLHYPDDDSTLVRIPRLVYHRLPTTLVTAKEAQIDGKGQHVRLIDDVIVTRGGKSGKPDSLLRTERLDAYPDDDIVVTDVPVTVIQGMSNIRGNTLMANNKSSFYVLDGTVRGVFFRNKNAAVKGDEIATSAPVTNKAVPSSLDKRMPEIFSPTKPKSKPQAKAKPQPKSKPKPKSQPASKVTR